MRERHAFVLAGLIAMAAPGQPQPPITFSAQAQVVRIEAVVTDRSGHPVRDLSLEDFSVFEDGRPKAVRDFHDGKDAGSASGLHAGASSTGAAPAGVPRGPAADPLTFVVYVDNRNLMQGDRARVLPGIKSFLSSQLELGNAAAVVISAGQAMQLVTPLTSDAAKVIEGLDGLRGQPVHGQVTRMGERQALDAVKGLLEGGGIGCDDLSVLQAPIRLQAEIRSQELQLLLSRINAVLQPLGALAGSKVFFYVSSGLEQRPAIDLFFHLGDLCPTAFQKAFSLLMAPMQEYDLSRAFTTLAAHANVNRVTFYPIDASGLRGPPLGDLSEGNRRFVFSPKASALRTENLRSGQWILADQTGGSAVFDANFPKKAMTLLADQIRSHYTLGFVPDHEPEGKTHHLRVEVHRRGVRVRHTRTYYHGVGTEASVRRSMAALLGDPGTDTLGANISLERRPIAEDRTNTAEVQLRIRVPLTHLSPLERTGSSPRARIRVIIAVWSTAGGVEGNAPELRERVFEVPLAPARANDTAATVWHELVVGVPVPATAADADFAVGVIDTVSNLATYRRLSLGGPGALGGE
ncbi:MAG: VWA domain-containing protein [Vicinamibacteria bacterium]